MLLKNYLRCEKRNFKKWYIYECSNCWNEKWYRYDKSSDEAKCNCDVKDKRVLNIFYKIRNKCNNPNNQRYHNYWWRWIKCEWNDSATFYNDVIAWYNKHVLMHWELNTSLDRINNDWNYCNDNCRWTTNDVQSNNKTSTRFITVWKRTQSMTNWANELWLNPWLVSQRINKLWWTELEALEITYREKLWSSPLVEFEWQTKTALEWCKINWIPSRTYHSRKQRWHNILVCVGLVPFKRKN